MIEGLLSPNVEIRRGGCVGCLTTGGVGEDWEHIATQTPELV